MATSMTSGPVLSRRESQKSPTGRAWSSAFPPEPGTRLIVLITGSRSWVNGQGVYDRLNKLVLIYPRMLVRHGKARWGADQWAAKWVAGARDLGYDVDEDPMPANWRNGRHKGESSAGMIRNVAMVRKGAHLCLAFIMPCRDLDCTYSRKPHGTHGASHCADRARAAGIVTWRYYGEPSVFPGTVPVGGSGEQSRLVY